jgi:hypothetical protein
MNNATNTTVKPGEEPTLPVIPRWSAVTTVLGLIAMSAGIAIIVGLLAGTGAGSSNATLRILGPLCCGALWALGGLLVWRRLARRRG